MKNVSNNNSYLVFSFPSLVLFLLILFIRTQTGHTQEIRLIVRGDDMAMTQGSLVAFEQAFNKGILTSGALQVPAPWFEAAAELCRRNPGWCVGVHLTLIAEWQGYRWRPVLPWDKVSSLVDEDGYFYRHPDDLFAQKPNIKEIEAEYRAQIDLALKRGIDVQYIDTHYMGYDNYPGLEEVFKRLGKEYNVPISGYMGEERMGGVYMAPEDQKTQLAVKQLEELEPGLWLWVCHIGIDSPEQNALFHTKPSDIFPGGGVGKHRAAELEVLLSIEAKSMIMKKGIILISYGELWEERK